MGILTFTQIKNEIKAHHGNRTDLDSRLSTVIDLSQLRIARLHDWDQLKFTHRGTLSASGDAIDDKIYSLVSGLPSGYTLKQIYSVRVVSNDGRSKKLIGKTAMEFDEKIPEPEFYDRGMPDWYTLFASVTQAGTHTNPTLELWRVPDEAYNITIRMQVWPRFLTDSAKADGDRSDLMLDDGLIHLSTSYLYNSLGREDKAKFHFGIYSAIVKEAFSLDETDFDTTIAAVKVNEGMGVGDYVANPFVSEVP